MTIDNARTITTTTAVAYAVEAVQQLEGQKFDSWALQSICQSILGQDTYPKLLLVTLPLVCECT